MSRQTERKEVISECGELLGQLGGTWLAFCKIDIMTQKMALMSIPSLNGDLD